MYFIDFHTLKSLIWNHTNKLNTSVQKISHSCWHVSIRMCGAIHPQITIWKHFASQTRRTSQSSLPHGCAHVSDVSPRYYPQYLVQYKPKALLRNASKCFKLLPMDTIIFFNVQRYEGACGRDNWRKIWK